MGTTRQRTSERAQSADRQLTGASPEATEAAPSNQAIASSLDGGTGDPSAIDFPHLAEIERALGQSPPGQAFLDPIGCADRGVEAFTEGQEVHFKKAKPDLDVAVHEAVHLLQHSGAVSDQGMGAEHHAEAVAHAAESGEDASPLLSSDGPRVTGDTHDFTNIPVADQGPGSPLEWESPGGNTLRVSDDGQLALDDEGYGSSQSIWAPASMISASNTILEGQGSRARLEAGSGTLTGKSPDSGTSHTLTEVVYNDQDSYFTDELTDDCGTASHEVMGAGDNLISAAQINDGSGGTTHLDPHRYVGGGGAPDQTAAETSFEEIMAREWPALTRDERYDAWEALSAPDRDAFEQKYGIGRYAVPEVGQGITIASLYDTPGWTPQPGVTGPTWNFHYATNILTSGSDYITLENYANHGAGNWFYWMSGPASKGQSFWDQHESQQGTFNTALVVDPAHDILVQVTNLAVSDWWGDADLYVQASTATGGTGESSEESLAIGDTHTFRVALADFLPERASEDITITVVEDDPFSSDELLSFVWTPPFETAGSGSNSDLSATSRMDL